MERSGEDFSTQIISNKTNPSKMLKFPVLTFKNPLFGRENFNFAFENIKTKKLC